MNKNSTKISIVDNNGIRRNANIYVGNGGSFSSGDLMDANAVEKLVEDKIAANEQGFITSNNGQLQVNETNITIVSNQPFPEGWPKNESGETGYPNLTFQDLITEMKKDEYNVQPGNVYLATVHYKDLGKRVGLVDAELKIEVTKWSKNGSKIAVFSITSANQAPYNWHTTLWNNTLYPWHSYELVTIDAPTIEGNTPFSSSTTATISGPQGATIYYTTDGATPTVDSTKYTSAISISSTTTVKAVAVKLGTVSPVAVKQFELDDNANESDMN